MTPSLIHLRIVVLNTEPDIWCDICGAFCATTTTYVVEEPTPALGSVHRFTSCDTCEGHQLC